MTRSAWPASADRYLQSLCAVAPNRRTGSPGNAEATKLIAAALQPFADLVEATPFPVLDYRRGEHSLTSGSDAFEAQVSPYSLGCDVRAPLVAASNLAELEASDCDGRILLLTGDLCTEPLMPKNFAFFNPAHHRHMIAVLERKHPAAILTATGFNPELAGALDPFPIFVDGDFDVPSLYCRPSVGEALARRQGEAPVHVVIDAERIPSRAANVVARRNRKARRKVVVTAHLDAYESAPGAIDNASGSVALMLAAELLAGYSGDLGIDFVALNGEDHYSAGGQMDYLRRFQDEFGQIELAINIDGVGFVRGETVYSFYECGASLQDDVRGVFSGGFGLVPGQPWYSGDHMLFVQKGVASVSLTAELAPELMRTIVHTSADTPALVDPRRLVTVAEALNALIRAL